MGLVESFLTDQEEEAVKQAIKAAEKETSGEIRVHLEGHSDQSVMDRAKDAFSELGMHKTQDSNGVLIYVAVYDHSFAIVGDKNINAVGGDAFWKSTRNSIESHFRNDRFAEGLIAGIEEVGKALSQHFPISPTDTDELSNQISKQE